MKELDCIEVVVEKDKYARHGVHKGMQGWICDPRHVQDTWLINFPQYGENDDIATISIKIEDLKEIPVMDPKVNERIKAQHENSGNHSKALPEKPDNLSGYLI